MMRSVRSLYHAEPADRPGHEQRLDELGSRPARLARLGQVLEQPFEVVGERRHLLLLELQRHDRARFSRLQVEHALTLRTDGAGAEVVGVGELERRGHETASLVRSSPVEFTVSTTGPDVP